MKVTTMEAVQTWRAAVQRWLDRCQQAGGENGASGSGESEAGGASEGEASATEAGDPRCVVIMSRFMGGEGWSKTG